MQCVACSHNTEGHEHDHLVEQEVRNKQAEYHGEPDAGIHEGVLVCSMSCS